MKKLIAISAGLLAGWVSAASAADMPVKAEPLPVAVGYDWTGWQFGIGIGNSWNRARWTDTVAPVVAHRWDQPQLSVHGVHQYQLTKFGLGNLVFGFEYSMSFPINDNVGLSACPNPAFGCQTAIEAVMTSGARLGWGFNRFMIYGSGGFARGEVVTSYVPPIAVAGATEYSRWHNGYYVGGGFDILAHKGNGIDLLIGAEYQHIDLSSKRHALGVGGVIVPGTTHDVRVRQDVVRGKITVKFNGPGFLGL